jgi:hypothetical protein
MSNYYKQYCGEGEITALTERATGRVDSDRSGDKADGVRLHGRTGITPPVNYNLPGDDAAPQHPLVGQAGVASYPVGYGGYGRLTQPSIDSSSDANDVSRLSPEDDIFGLEAMLDHLRDTTTIPYRCYQLLPHEEGYQHLNGYLVDISKARRVFKYPSKKPTPAVLRRRAMHRARAEFLKNDFYSGRAVRFGTDQTGSIHPSGCKQGPGFSSDYSSDGKRFLLFDKFLLTVECTAHPDYFFVFMMSLCWLSLQDTGFANFERICIRMPAYVLVFLVWGACYLVGIELNPGPAPKTCRHCTKKFEGFKLLDAHVIKEHPLVCRQSDCKFVAKDVKSLKEHKNRAHPIYHKCACGAFIASHLVQTHRKTECPTHLKSLGKEKEDKGKASDNLVAVAQAEDDAKQAGEEDAKAEMEQVKIEEAEDSEPKTVTEPVDTPPVTAVDSKTDSAKKLYDDACEQEAYDGWKNVRTGPGRYFEDRALCENGVFLNKPDVIRLAPINAGYWSSWQTRFYFMYYTVIASIVLCYVYPNMAPFIRAFLTDSIGGLVEKTVSRYTSGIILGICSWIFDVQMTSYIVSIISWYFWMSRLLKMFFRFKPKYPLMTVLWILDVTGGEWLVNIFVWFLGPDQYYLGMTQVGKAKPASCDVRPEFDRAEFLARNNYQNYQLVVMMKIYGVWIVRKNWCDLSLLCAGRNWYKHAPRSPTCHSFTQLKKVRLNLGLLASCLNRKTYPANKGTPELALDKALRLMQANPHYQEDPTYVAKARSTYEDMAVVCGVILTKDPSLPNSYF